MNGKLPFDDNQFTVIYADPPWSYSDKGFGKRKNGALSNAYAPEAGRYETMTLDEIVALGSELQRISAKNAALLLWVSSPLLPEGLQVLNAWGFKYKTIAFCWSKETENGGDVVNLGQWTLGNIELCLLGTRGSPERIDRTVKQLCRAGRSRHSAKPIEIRRRIERLFGNTQRLELFAREQSLGWHVWGNESDLPREERSDLAEFM